MKALQNVIKNVNFKVGSGLTHDKMKLQNLKVKCERLIYINTAKLEEAQREVDYLVATLKLLETLNDALSSLERKENDNER